MSHYANTTLTGRLIADPEMRTTPSGAAVCSFRLASNLDHGEVLFQECCAWRAMAELVCNNFKKGQDVFVAGMPVTKTWTAADGRTHSKIELRVATVALIGNVPAEVI